MTPTIVMSQLTQCATLGWRGAPPPRPPQQRYGGAAPAETPPSMSPSPGRRIRIMSAGVSPGVRRRTVTRGRQAASRLLRWRSGPCRVTAAADRAGKLLRASRKAGPLSTPGAATSGEPLRCRGAPTRRRRGGPDRFAWGRPRMGRPFARRRWHGRPSRMGEMQPGATRAMGVTEEPIGPENRRFSLGRSRHNARRNIGLAALVGERARSSNDGALQVEGTAATV